MYFRLVGNAARVQDEVAAAGVDQALHFLGDLIGCAYQAIIAGEVVARLGNVRFEF